MKITVQLVLGNVLRSRAFVFLFLPADDRLDPCESHEPKNPLVVNRLVRISTELEGVPSVTVNASHLLMEGQHVLQQLLILALLRAGFVVYPLVVAEALCLCNLAEQLDAKPLFVMYRLYRPIHMDVLMPA